MNNMTTENKTQLQSGDSIHNLLSLLSEGLDAIVKSGEMLLRLHSADNDIFNKILDQNSKLSRGFLSSLLKIGEHTLHPDLLLNGCPAYKRIASLPYAVQESIIKQKAIDVVINPAGDVLRVPVTDLTPAQIKQTIDIGGIRSRDTQRAVVKQSLTKAPPQNDPTHKVFKDKVVIYRACEFTRRELLRMVEEMS